MTTTNNNFRVKNGLEVATTATMTTLKFSGDGIAITSRASLIGAQGPQGPQGPAGQSSNYYRYKTKTGTTSGDPGAGFLIWNTATQRNATQINLSHLDDDGNDIDVFLALLNAGDNLVVQDQNDSDNYQVWIVSNPITIFDNSYVEVPVTLVSSTGTGYTGFSNNHPLLFIVQSAGVVGPTGPTGPQGPTGATGPQGPQGVQGNTGPSGPQGVQGNTGAQGPQGPQGNAGAQGPQGNEGPQGPSGPQGSIGATGPSGPQGNTGAQGPQGPTGNEGPQGPQGNTGATGPSGPQGAQGTAGAQGPQGPGADQALNTTSNVTFNKLNITTTATTGHHLPNTDATFDLGSASARWRSLYVTTSTIYIDNYAVSVVGGNLTIDGNSQVGPTGPQGPSGPQGSTGAQGPQGPQGNTGAQGPQGPQGNTGAQGPQGPQGNTGAQGPQGPQGNEGPQGPQGTAGAQGPSGPQGAQGSTGAQGPSGPSGPGFQFVTSASTTATSTSSGIILITTNGGRPAYYNTTASEWRYVATEAVVYTPPASGDAYWADTRVYLSGETVADNSSFAHSITNNGVTTSTTQVKFGTSSLYFDGSSYLTVTPSGSDLAPGSGNFTIDFWAYHTAGSPYDQLYHDTRPGDGNTNNTILFFRGHSAGRNGGLFDYGNGSFVIEDQGFIPLNEWVHVAISRSSGVTKGFINGTQVASQSDSINYSKSGCNIGATIGNEGAHMRGYIDSFRLTPGVARYTASFTPPTASDYGAP